MEYNWINILQAAIIIIMLIPNIIFFIKNPYNHKKCKNIIINTTEQAGRYASITLMIFPILVKRFSFQSNTMAVFYVFITSLLLLSYLVVYFFYFKSISYNKAIILALLPSIIFIISGILLTHYLLIISGLMFGTAHILITLQNNQV